MGKYRQTIDIDAHNSTAHILRAVRSNTTVLEFGASSGYMTQYMKESLGCQVHIIEIDPYDGLEASQWAESSLIGAAGNIELYSWVNFYSDEKFDHIIFSDVLEHLKDPWNVLKKASKLLDPKGSIIISVPNISHNSVIIDLINNKFDYRDLGLLDNTHVRFFTRPSLEKMVIDAGLRLEKEMNTFCSVEHTEFNNSLDDVPEHVAEELKNRPDGLLYQFVWELKF